MPVLFMAPLAPVVMALAAMLLLWALAILLVKPLQVVFRAIPFIGSQVADAVGHLAGMLSDFLTGLINSELQAATNLIDWFAGHATKVIRWATGAAVWLGSTLRTQIAFLMGWAGLLATQATGILARVGTIAGQVAGLLAHVAAIAAQLARTAAVVIPAAIGTAVSLAVARATALLSALRLALTAAIATALSTALRAVGLEAASRAAADLAVRSWAAAAMAAQAATAAVNLAHLSTVVNTEIASLGRTIGLVDARIGAIAAPTVAIAIGTIVTEIATMRRTCVDPMCSFLTPQLRALELAEDIGMLAAVSAIVAAAVHDPEGAARETIDTSRPLIGGAASLLGELAGFHL